MILLLERRTAPSATLTFLSPILAIGITAIIGGIIFTTLGLDPLKVLYLYFVEPLTSLWSIEEVIVKAAPLILIGVGLSVCFSANVWNIGAEGQLTVGALFGSAIPVYFTGWQSPSVLILMLMLGAVGGAVFAAIPALLKTRFNANEILTSLMLVYVAQLLLDWMVRGPWRDPQGYNFPQSVPFEGWQLLPTLGDGRVHVGALLAVVAAIILFFMMNQSLRGFEIRVIGSAPRAGAFAGFAEKRVIWFCFLLSGALAGLAGLCEVAGPSGQLQPTISPGYGFTAIIVAFLGRLNPVGVIFAGILLAISYLGGEAVQVEFNISNKSAQVFQGILLFLILACDTLIHYRIKIGASVVKLR
ncbi:MAG: sugar ABC transporter permease [Rhodospirillaceae bacterium]|nr:sugar ABC transporter permease [Rhodospirillaceae bacterium]